MPLIRRFAPPSPQGEGFYCRLRRLCQRRRLFHFKASYKTGGASPSPTMKSFFCHLFILLRTEKLFLINCKRTVEDARFERTVGDACPYKKIDNNCKWKAFIGYIRGATKARNHLTGFSYHLSSRSSKRIRSHSRSDKYKKSAYMSFIRLFL